MKDPALRRRVVELLPEALDLSGSTLERFLDQHGSDDPRLRSELEALLGDASEMEEEFLSVGAVVLPETMDLGTSWQPSASPTTVTATPPVEQLPVPEMLGRYRVIERLGKGGMGAVYLGEQARPVRRRAALKVIDSIHDRGRQHKRFAAECQALARLSHPNVAALYEVGTTADGHPFVAMEPVEGAPITDWCDQRELGFQRRIELFCGVCAGVRHAHEKGVLHRDIKPGNVLVTQVDGRSMAKLIDFGIASALDGHLLTGANLSAEHLLAGSPAYMSPEAVGFGPGDLDTRADVYSLGVLLFELLVGVRPIVSHQGDSLHDFLKRIGEEPLPSMSDRWDQLDGELQSKLAKQRWTQVRGLRRGLQGDLDAIVRKATEKDRERRYHSPAGLATDLRRYLERRPIGARPATTAYLTNRFVARHLVATVAVGLFVLTLIGGIAAVGMEVRRAKQAEFEAEQVADFLFGLLELSAPAGELAGSGAADVESLLRVDELADTQFVSRLGPKRLSRLAASLIHLSRLYLDLGRVSDAEPLLLQSVAIHRALPEPEPPNLAAALLLLGELHLDAGRLREAEGALREALEIRRSHPDSAPSEVIQALALLILAIDGQQLGEADREGLHGQLSVVIATLESPLDKRSTDSLERYLEWLLDNGRQETASAIQQGLQ